MHGTNITCILTTSSWLKRQTKSVRPRQLIKIRKGINYKDNNQNHQSKLETAAYHGTWLVTTLT